jgi:hypothetical protein
MLQKTISMFNNLTHDNLLTTAASDKRSRGIPYTVPVQRHSRFFLLD